MDMKPLGKRKMEDKVDGCWEQGHESGGLQRKMTDDRGRW